MRRLPILLLGALSLAPVLDAAAIETNFSRDVAAAMLAGLGVMAGSVSLGALIALVTVGLVNALVWYGRLHLKLLKPALEGGEVRS